MLNTVIYSKLGKIKRPVIKVFDNEKNQVVLNFLCSKNEHLTLHLKEDGSIIRTHWSQNKSKKSWDDVIIGIARELGYSNPEKHGKYIVHDVIGYVYNDSNFHLLSKSIDISDAPIDKDKYKKLKNMMVCIKKQKVMFSFYLYTKNFDKSDINCIHTSLGLILIKIDLFK